MDHSSDQLGSSLEGTMQDPVLSGEQYSDLFHQLMLGQGCDFASGVPCGVLKHFIRNIRSDKRILHLPGQNEPECVGIAAGAYLGGKNPVLYMQNSGMLKSTNDLASLLMVYNMPILMLVSYRGCPGEDAAQHMVTGRITIPLLREMGLFYRELETDNVEKTVHDSYESLRQKHQPAIVLVKRGWTKQSGHARPDDVKDAEAPDDNNHPKTSSTGSTLCKTEEYGSVAGPGNALSPFRISNLREKASMKREEALEAIISGTSSSEAIISTTGLMSRSLYELHDSPNQFYNTGGFGLVSSIGLGFAAARPEIRTVVVDGDGSLLTNLGTLRTIGSYKPQNLVHIVIDNNSYGSCSEELTASADAQLASVAGLQGYRQVYIADSASALETALRGSAIGTGPVFIQVHTVLGGRRDFKRPADLPYIAKRFRNYFTPWI
jgi:phosphonopyruvate decarboxylase